MIISLHYRKVQVPFELRLGLQALT